MNRKTLSLVAAGMLTFAAAGSATPARAAEPALQKPIAGPLFRQACDGVEDHAIGPFNSRLEADDQAAVFDHDPDVAFSRVFYSQIDPDFVREGHSGINRGAGWYVYLELRN